MLALFRSLLGPEASVSPARNAYFSIVAFVLSAFVSLLVSPIIIRTLGDAPYGLLSLASELTAQFALFDLGIRSALNYYVAQGLARNDEMDLACTLQTAILILCGLGGVASIASVGVVVRLSDLFILDGIQPTEARLAVGILLAVFALGFPMSVYSALLSGSRRYDIANLIAIVSSLFTAAFVLFSLKVWGTITAYAIAQASGVVLRWGLQFLALSKLQLTLKFWPFRFNGTRARQLFGFGGANLVLNLATMVILQADLLIIGRMIGASAAGQYQVGRYLGVHLLSFTGAVLMTLPSNFTFYKMHDDHISARNLFSSSSRYINGIACLLSALIIVFGESFISLWAGPQFIVGGFWDRGGTILLLITLAMLARSMSGVSYQYLLGIRRVREITIVRIIEAVISLCSSIVMLQWLGLGGVSLSKLIVSAASLVFFSVPFCCRDLKIPLASYGWNAIVRPFLLLFATLVIAVIVRSLVAFPGWLGLLVGGATAALGGAYVGWWVICDSSSRATVASILGKSIRWLFSN